MEAASDLPFFILCVYYSYALLAVHSAIWQSVEETLGCRCTRLYLATSDADDSFSSFFFLAILQREGYDVMKPCVHIGLFPGFHILPASLFAVPDSLSITAALIFSYCLFFSQSLVLGYIWTSSTAEPLLNVASFFRLQLVRVCSLNANWTWRHWIEAYMLMHHC